MKLFDEVRWGIVGCGDVTEVKSGPAFNKVAGSRLVAVMRRDAKKARDYAQRHRVPQWHDDAQALIENSEVNAVYIATPPQSHEELALRVAAAGKPCYVEKPMARSYAECSRMVAAFESAQLPLFVAFYRRALPRFVRAKAIIEAGQLGEISSVNYRMTQPVRDVADEWRFEAQMAGAGLFLDLGSHTLDVLDWLLGPLLHSRGSAVNIAGKYAVEDGVTLSFRLQNGAPGSGSWNFAGSLHEDIITIDGTLGRLQMSTFGASPICLQTTSGTQELHDEMPAHVQQPLIQSIVDELRGVGICPSTGVSGARTSRVMDSALHDFYGGRDDDFWTRTASWPGLSRP